MNRTLTRRIAFIEQYDLVVGIDLGKRGNVAVMLDRQGQVQGRFQFSHDRAGYERLVCWLGQRCGAAGVVVGMEPTNDYWQWLAGYLSQAGIAYRLVNAFTVKKSREGGQLDYAKDDRRDAWVIAHLLRTGQFTESQLARGVYALLRDYEQAHWRLQGDLGRAKTVLRQQVERLFPEIGQVFKGLTGHTVSAVLVNHAQPAQIAALSWPDFIQAVGQDFTGQRLQVKKLRQLYDLAPQSVGVQTGAALQQLIRQQQATLAQQQQQLAALKTALVSQLHSLPLAPYWLSLGLGLVTTALLAAELGDPSHFRRANQWVKLAGIQPTPNQSGNYQRKQTPMSHKGRPRLRTYLFWATLRLVGNDPAFQACYEQAKQARQQPPLAAMGVMMNKLVHVLWALARQQTYYDPRRLTG